MTNPTPYSSTVNPWTTRNQVLALPNFEDFDKFSVLDEQILVASELLFILSGKQWAGAMEVVDARPTRRLYRYDGVQRSSVDIAGGYALGYGTRYEAESVTSHYHPVFSNMGSTHLPVLWLGEYPLVSIQEVRIDGQPLDSGAYEIEDWQRLVRVDGEGWPTVQDLRAASTEPGTFGVDFTWGFNPPHMGGNAATRLAGELTLSQVNPGKTQLPKRIQQITRQNLSAVLLDPFAMLEEGRTGIYEVDLFLAAINPGKLRAAPMVITPDTMQTTVRKTWRADG